MKERVNIMTKEQFIKIVNQIEELNREQEEFSYSLHKLDNEFGGCLIHNKTITILCDLLKELMNDTSDWISYYMWEINFGKGYYEGCITESNGTPITLRNADDLYNLITQ